MNYLTDKQSIENFIIHAFNYYNGRINYLNKAILKIEWGMIYNFSNGGTTQNPNIVTIYPKIIELYSDSPFQFYYITLETIIHELFHIDQIIDYPRMAVNNDYRIYIESAVEVQTYIYIANHVQEILEEFGISMLISKEVFREELLKRDFGYCYFRRRYNDHIIIMLNEMIGGIINTDKIYRVINDNISTLTGKIVITLGDNSTIIQEDKYLAPIDELNNFFYINYFQFDYRNRLYTNYKIVENYNSNDLYITLKSDFKNIMANICY